MPSGRKPSTTETIVEDDQVADVGLVLDHKHVGRPAAPIFPAPLALVLDEAGPVAIEAWWSVRALEHGGFWGFPSGSGTLF